MSIVAATFALALLAPAQEGLNQRNYLARLSPGINIGNTLEAIPAETSWGNPVPTQKLMNGYRAAGFKSIRIPVAYTQYSSPDHVIQKKWMDHVVNVVNMAVKADMYALVNIHWDGGWLQPTYKDRQATEAKFRKYWIQIANRFKNAGDKVMFAGTNEVGVHGEYGPPAPENAEVQNGFNQIFVDTVRATGGRNRNRYLVVQAYNTDIDNCMKHNLTMPKDKVEGRLMMEVHYYSPYHFTLNEKSDIWQWGKTATDPKFTDTWGNEDYVDGQFLKMKTNFVDKGYPVILGEYGTGFKPKFPEMEKYRQAWTEYVTSSAYRHGTVPMYWDTGALIDRNTGAVKDKAMMAAILRGIPRP